MRKMKFLFWVVLACVIAAGPLFGEEKEKSKAIEFTILYFNDVHGHLQPFSIDSGTKGKKKHWGGLARLAWKVEDIRSKNRKEGKKTFLLYGGDLLMGTPMSTVFKGEPGILAFKKMGVQAFAVGNHEFDFGQKNFQKLIRLAEKGEKKVPIISVNIFKGKDRRDPYLPASVVLPLGQGHSLHVIGATTEETPVTTFPDNVRGLSFGNPVREVARHIKRVRVKGPVVVVSHCGWQVDQKIAAENPRLLAIVGGHDQVLFPKARKVGKTLVGQAFEKCKYLGRMDFRYHPSTGRAEVLRDITIPITQKLPVHPEVKAIVDSYEKRINARFREKIAVAKVFLDGSRGKIRYHETNLGNLITDIMREKTGAELALLNSGSIRGSINKGPVSIGDIFKAFPYSNELWKVKIKGKTLQKILARSVRGDKESEDGGFLQVSGLTMKIKGKEVVEVKIQGNPLVPDKTYSVAVTNFMKAGGDGYHWLKKASGKNLYLPLRSLLIHTFRQKKVLAPKEEDRIQRVEAEKVKSQ